MTHTVHECEYCGVIWPCDGLHPYTEPSCIRPYIWSCRPCWEAGRITRCNPPQRDEVIDGARIGCACPACRELNEGHGTCV